MIRRLTAVRMPNRSDEAFKEGPLIVGYQVARQVYLPRGDELESQDACQRNPFCQHGLVLLLGVIHFWWWEFSLRLITHWSFWTYIFILSYASLFFLMSTLLYPDHINDHAEREEYFIRRRIAFFALFALSFAFDIVDTMIKGKEHFASLGEWYPVRTIVGITIALVAMRTNSSRILMWLGVGWLLCNALWITMLYSELI